MIKVACVQLNAGPDIGKNLDQAELHIRNAASQGASFVATPENTCHMIFPQSEKLNTSPKEEDHPALPKFSALAKELGITILIGSVSVLEDSGERIANRSFLFGSDGAIIGRYDKIHLFDVDLEKGESYRESDVVRAGEVSTLADAGDFKLGMSICYDVRFPYLYRELATNGAQILAVPAAFTVPTGKAHWKELLRARAIETGSFVIAPAQCGEHAGGRHTYGHSLIIDPWGEVLAEAGDDVGIIMADIDLDKVNKVRASIPSLKHTREYMLVKS